MNCDHILGSHYVCRHDINFDVIDGTRICRNGTTSGGVNDDKHGIITGNWVSSFANFVTTVDTVDNQNDNSVTPVMKIYIILTLSSEFTIA